MKNQVCLDLTMPHLGLFGPWKFGHPLFVRLADTCILAWVLLHTGACANAALLTYCHANNAITHFHAATNINSDIG